jgi:hypothetical protein
MVDAKVEQKLVGGINTEYCVFYFDTRQITHPSNISIQNLPQSGSYTNVRFDIDDDDFSQQNTGYYYPYNGTDGYGRAYGTYNIPFWDNSVYVSILSDGTIWTNANALSLVINNDNPDYQDVTMTISLDGKTGDITF